MNSSTQGTSPHSIVFPAWLAAGVLLVNLVVILSPGHALLNSRHQYHQQAEVSTQTMSHALTEYAFGIHVPDRNQA